MSDYINRIRRSAQASHKNRLPDLASSSSAATSSSRAFLGAPAAGRQVVRKKSNCRSKKLAPTNKENGMVNRKANVLPLILEEAHASAAFSPLVQSTFTPVAATTATATNKKLCATMLDKSESADVEYLTTLIDLTEILDEEDQDQRTNITQKTNKCGTSFDNYHHKQSRTKTAAPRTSKYFTTNTVSNNVASVIEKKAKACPGEESSCSGNEVAHPCSVGSVDVDSDLSFDFAETQQD
ncbi:hypothetical protein ACA910_012526 [Epithemia clementina (nom. ined.)]